MGKTIIRYKNIGKYSGFVVYGEKPFEKIVDSHLDRAVHLTALVETGNKRGSIMAADGTGVTAGRCQNVLVYPNATDEQGSLSELLSKIFDEVEDTRVLKPLRSSFEQVGWYLYNGKFRHKYEGSASVEGKNLKCNANSIVNGSILRSEITGPYGVVPSDGQSKRKARNWVILFHELFAHSSTEKIQMDFEREQFAKRIKRTKIQFNPRRRGITLQKLFYKNEDPLTFDEGWMSPQMDLALCVFYSHSVNAPSAAKKLLEQVVIDTGFTPDDAGSLKECDFAKALLEALGKSQYGRWNHNVKSGRWFRTRKNAMEMKVWPKNFFASQKYRGIIPIHFF
jgi:hypothetical protein